MSAVVVYSGPSAHTTTGSALTLVIPLLSLLLLFALGWFIRRRLLTGSGPLASPMAASEDPLSRQDAPGPAVDRAQGEPPPRREGPPDRPER